MNLNVLARVIIFIHVAVMGIFLYCSPSVAGEADILSSSQFNIKGLVNGWLIVWLNYILISSVVFVYWLVQLRQKLIKSNVFALFAISALLYALLSVPYDASRIGFSTAAAKSLLSMFFAVAGMVMLLVQGCIAPGFLRVATMFVCGYIGFESILNISVEQYSGYWASSSWLVYYLWYFIMSFNKINSVRKVPNALQRA